MTRQVALIGQRQICPVLPEMAPVDKTLKMIYNNLRKTDTN